MSVETKVRLVIGNGEPALKLHFCRLAGLMEERSTILMTVFLGDIDSRS